jgi:diguanylate cyclase (GGDEF)-like protein
MTSNNDQVDFKEAWEFLKNTLSSPCTNLEGFLEKFLIDALLFAGGDFALFLLWEPNSMSYRLKLAPQDFSLQFLTEFDASNQELSSLFRIKNPTLLENEAGERLNLSSIFPSIHVLPQSALLVPIENQGKIYGTLLVLSQKEKAFRGEQLDFLALAGKIAGLHLENQYQTSENRNRIQQMKALIDVSRQINASLYLDEAIKAVRRSAKELLQLPDVFVLLLEENQITPFEHEENKYSQIPQRLSGILNSVLKELKVQRKPTIYTDLPGDFLKSYSLSGVGLLPIIYQDDLLGFLAVPLPERRTLSPEELLVAQSIANQCGVAITNSRLFSETKQKAEEFSSLFEVAQTLMGSLHVEEIVSKALESAQKLVKADEGFIFELVEGSEEMHCIAVSGSYKDQIKSMKIRVGEGITGWVAKAGVGVNLAEAELDPRVKQVNGTPVEEESLISVPLKIKDEVIGVMTVSRLGHHPFTEGEFRLITIFSSFAASAIYNARLFRNVSEMAITDYLTGLYNYRYFFRRLEEELSYAQRHGQKLVLVYIDLNQFKKYNDSYGHREGDKVLAKFARLLKENVRVSDVVFRYGGEEFVIILPSTEAQEAEQIIERLHKKIAESFPPDSKVPISASIGYAVFPVDATDGETLLRIADARMYAQKEVKRAISV